MAIIGTLPNNIQNGQAVDANPVMADFNFIVNQVNANANPLGTLTAPSGTRVVFNQQTAPLGWVIDATVTDHTIQLINGAGTNVITTGTNYSALFNNPWTSDGHALSTAELAVHGHGITDPGHVHSVNDTGHVHTAPGGSFLVSNGGSTLAAGTFAFSQQGNTNISNTGISLNTSTTGIGVSNTGSGTAHSHTKTFNVNYCQCIVASKT